ncbi:MAG: hypothetical protein ACI87E_001883 [Mariniblastus sp.]|jgi:hypothetical protein
MTAPIVPPMISLTSLLIQISTARFNLVVEQQWQCEPSGTGHYAAAARESRLTHAGTGRLRSPPFMNQT